MGNNKSKFIVLSIVALLMLSISASSVVANDAYTTQKTTQLNLDDHGVCTVIEEDLGIKYEIEGAAGATGSVTAAVYSGNPQPTASVPEGISLSKFTVLTFDMDAHDFTSATITFSYTDEDVLNIQPPYTIYKYLPASDSFVEIPATVDTEAKTLTITLSSTDDPLFAIGGAAIVNNVDDSTTLWFVVAALTIVAVIVTVFLVVRLRSAGKI